MFGNLASNPLNAFSCESTFRKSVLVLSHTSASHKASCVKVIAMRCQLTAKEIHDFLLNQEI